MTLPTAVRGPVGILILGGASALAALLAGLVALALGPTTALVLLIGAIGALLALAAPRVTVGEAVGAFIVAELRADTGYPVVYHLYDKTPAFFTPIELLLLLALAAVLLDAVRGRTPLRLPGILTIPFALVLASLFAGLVNAHLRGAGFGFPQRGALEEVLPLVIVPFLVVNVVRTPEALRAALAALAVIAVVKAVVGLGLLGLGRSQELIEGQGTRLTYYDATANILGLMTLLALAAARLSGVRLPRWLVWSGPLIFACLLLSYRRMFWVVTVAGLLLVAIAASGRVGRRLAVPAVVLLVAGVWLISQAQVVGDISGPIVERGESISPTKVTHNEQDRYRIAERHNVIQSIKQHPIAGVGVGVGWQTFHPMPFDEPSSHTYNHIAVLWWWLNMGLLGAMTYVGLMLSAAYIGLAVWRRHPDRVVRVGGLAAGVGLLGLAAVELTSTVIGPDQRGNVLVGAVAGLLAVAHRQARASSDATSTASIA